MVREIISFILGTFATTGVFVYFLTHPEKVEKWLSMFWWLVSRLWKGAEYLAIKNEVQGKINSFVKNLEAYSAVSFPRVSIKWVAKENEEIVWEDGEVIIVMRDREHRNKNFVHAAYFFTSEVLLKKSKRHLSKNQKLSLDLFATKRILERESAAAVEQFMNDYFIPNLEKNQDIKGFIQKYQHIDRMGIFFPVLIQELSYLGNKVFLTNPTAEIIAEVKSLIDFLEKFSEREVGDTKTPDTFIGKYTRCAIKIVASHWTREKGDITSSKERILKALKSGLENVYVVGSDKKENKEFVENVVGAVCEENNQVEIKKEYSFKNELKFNGALRRVDSCLIYIHNPSAVKFLYEKNDIDSLIG